MKIIAIVTNIHWDVDFKNQRKDLPNIMTLELSTQELQEEDLHDYISDKITDITQFCHDGFNYTLSVPDEYVQTCVNSFLNTVDFVRFDSDEKPRGWSLQARKRATQICFDFIGHVFKEFTPVEAEAIFNNAGKDNPYLWPADLAFTMTGADHFDHSWEERFSADLLFRLNTIADVMGEVSPETGKGGWADL